MRLSCFLVCRASCCDVCWPFGLDCKETGARRARELPFLEHSTRRSRRNRFRRGVTCLPEDFRGAFTSLLRPAGLVGEWGIITIGGEQPHIHKLGLINMGSTLALRVPLWKPWAPGMVGFPLASLLDQTRGMRKARVIFVHMSCVYIYIYIFIYLYICLCIWRDPVSWLKGTYKEHPSCWSGPPVLRHSHPLVLP